MRKVIYLVIISFVVSASSCEKEDFTLPTQVNFEFTMESFYSEGGLKAGPSFDIDEGTLVVKAIEFDGRRDQGGDYYFTSEFSTPVKAEMHNGNMNQIVSYNIPQGVYNRIELNLSIGDGNEDALCLNGRFQVGPFVEIPVRIEYAFQEQIRIRATNKDGNEQIVLKKDIPSTATVIFNVPFLFQLVNIGMILDAERVQLEGEEVILINNEKNTDIFNLLATRLDNSMRVIFD